MFFNSSVDLFRSITISTFCPIAEFSFSVTSLAVACPMISINIWPFLVFRTPAASWIFSFTPHNLLVGLLLLNCCVPWFCLSLSLGVLTNTALSTSVNIIFPTPPIGAGPRTLKLPTTHIIHAGTYLWIRANALPSLLPVCLIVHDRGNFFPLR